MKLNLLFITQDDRMVLEFITSTLEEYLNTSIDIFDTDNEKQALNIIENNSIDLIITDMNIDTISSYEFYDNLKATLKFQEIPFVFLSSDEEDQTIAKQRGINNFFLKPLDVEQLLESLKQILSHSKKSNMINHLQEDFKSEVQEINNILKYTNKIEHIIDNDLDKDIIKELLSNIKEETNKLISIHSKESNTL